MGRKTDVLLKGFRAAKCLTLLKVATARIKVVKNKRSMSAKQMRAEIAQLIKSGQDAQVYITKADALIKQENMVAVYDLLDQYCHAVMSRFPAIEMQRNCPIDMKEPIASIIYAAPRCVELTELPAIKEAFVAKYGKDFAAAASELRPDCGVNTQIIELLSTRPATGDMKLKLMKEICMEHKVDWTPPEALAGPAVATGRAEAKVEPMQAIGTFGSIKANVGVGEAGPSKTAPLQGAGPSKIAPLQGAGPSKTAPQQGAGPSKTAPQGASKHGASNKVGLAEAMVAGKAGSEVLFATNAKTSDQKQSSASQGEAVKSKSSVSDSLKGTSSEASSKAAAIAPDASKADNVSLGSFEEEDARRLHARILQSLKGSFVDSERETETNAEVSVEPMGAQVGMSDSDSDSFVSVEEERFEDDVEPSLDKAASRKEGFGVNSNQGLAGADLHRPSLSKKLSDTSQQENYSRASSKNSGAAMEMHVRVNSNQGLAGADLHRPSLSKKLSDSSQQEIYSKASCKNSGAAVEMHEGMPASSLPSESSHEDMFVRASSRKSSNAGGVLEKGNSKDSLNMGRLVEAQSAEESKEDRIINEHEDMFLRVSSKKSSNNAEVMEKVSRKDSLNMGGKILEAQSVEKLNEDMNMDEKVAEDFVETSEKEGLQTKDSLKDMSDEATIESSSTQKLSKKHSFEARKTAEEPSDEGLLPDEGIIKVTSSVATIGIELEEKHIEDCSLDATEVESIAEDKPRLPSFEISKDQSGPERVFDEEMPSAAGEEPCLSNEELPEHGCNNAPKVLGEEPSPSSENAVESGGGVSGSLPAVGTSVEELVGASISALVTLENNHDFAATAKAIAAEAARLALLDYAKRMAESGSIPLDLSELSKLGVAFEEKTGGPQDKKTSKSEVSFESIDSEVLGYAGDSKSEVHAVEEVKIFREGTVLNDDKGHQSDQLDVEKMSANNEKFKPPVAADAIDGEIGSSLNASIAAEARLQEMVTETEHIINPFATSIATNINKDADALLLEKDEEKVSWQTSKVESYGGDDDHLDIFFKRKTTWMSEERPMFNEDRYSFLKPKPSVIEEKMPYDGFDKKLSRLQEDLFSEPLFDTVAEGQSTTFEESSDSFKSPVFDEGEGGSFKSPVFDEGPEPYDAAFSSSVDGLDKSNLFAKVSDKREPQYTPSIKSPASFDPDPEPCFDKVADEDKLLSKERTKSPSTGQLKWQSKKPVNPVEHDVTPDGKSGNPMSRRSRRQPKVYDDSEYRGDSSSQLTSRSSLMQQEDNEPVRIYKDSVGEKKAPGTRPIQPYVFSSSAMSQRPSDPPKWVTGQADYDLPLRDEGDSRSTQISSIRTTASPTRLVNRQRLRAEDYYFAEENDSASSSVGTGMSRKATKSPTRIKQSMTHDYVDAENDPAGYQISYNIPRIPKLHQQDMVEDDHTEVQGKYKPSSQIRDMNKRTSAGSGIDSWQQQRHRQEEPGMRYEHKQYREGVGESPRTRPMSSRQQQKKFIEEEPYLVSRYKSTSKVDEPLDYEDDDYEQQLLRQEKPVMGSKYKHYREDVGESSSTRPMSNTRQQKKYIQEEEPHLISRHKQPLIQDNEPLDYESIYKSKTSNLYQLGMLVDDDHEPQQHRRQEEPGMRVVYKQNNEDGREGLRTKPMSRRQQQKDIEEEEPSLVSRYKPMIQEDNEPLDYGSNKSWRTPKVYQLKKDSAEDDEDLRARYGLHTQMDDLGRRASASSGVDRLHQRYHQQEEDALESGYMHYEKSTAGEERISKSRLSAGPKPSDFEEEPYLASGYESPKQRVKSSPSRPLASRRQEKKHFEEVESASRFSTSTAMYDNVSLHYREEEEEEEEKEQLGSRLSSEHKQHPQQNQYRPTPSDDHEIDSQSKRENSEHQRQERIQKVEQQPSYGRRHRQSNAEEEVHEGGKKQHLPSYSNPQEKLHTFDELPEEKQRHNSTTLLPEGQQEQVGQVSKPSLSPSYSHKQDSGLEENLSKSSQQVLEHVDGGISARKEKHRPQEKGVNEQQEKTDIKENPVELEEANGQQYESSTKSQLLKEQPPQSTSPPLDSSISDPIILATIPPPVKKRVTQSPTAVKLESSASAPSSSNPAEAKTPKLPSKPPNLVDLAANYEAFRRAKKGE